ncbi:MAG: cobalt-precorrin 5A hydrolase [Ethanoligenens sp.]
MNIKIVSFTRDGALFSLKLCKLLDNRGFDATGYYKEDMPGLVKRTGDILKFAESAFESCDALIFVGAAGIAVRAVAPYLRGKDIDPAVLVCDEKGRYVIPILSGHLGGANRLAEEIAEQIGAAAVLTTATDINGKFAADVWARDNNCRVFDPPKIKAVSSAILAGEPVGFLSDFPVDGAYPKGVFPVGYGKIGILVSLDVSRNPFAHTLHLVPQCIAIGIGCKRGVTHENVEEQFLQTLAAGNVPVKAVNCVASINLKAKEAALLALCEKYCLPFQTFSAQELAGVQGEFTDSDFVRRTTGVGNVCERAAVKASGGTLIIRKTAGKSVTTAAAKADWKGQF